MNEPLFCPNESCPNHKPKEITDIWFERFGTYFTKAFGRVPRYRCRHCGKTCSNQTFSIDYYAKKIVDYNLLSAFLSSSMNDRAIGRNLGIAPVSVINRIHRAARACIAGHLELLSEVRLCEDLAADGFESFDVSQYFPNNIHLLAGKESQFVYYFNHVSMKRKGRMRDSQKEKLAILYAEINYKPGSISESFTDVAEEIAELYPQKSKSPLYLYTDEKPQYPESVMKIPLLLKEKTEGGFDHIQINSKIARNTSNDLFSVNYLDREIRKDIANHRRETTCFGRNVNNVCARLMVYFYTHNYKKKYRIDQPVDDDAIHAEVAGIRRESIDIELSKVFKLRRVKSHIVVKGFLKKLWLRELKTPGKLGPEKIPVYAVV